MRVAAGDGNTADPSSPYCAHYPGSGTPRRRSSIGMALLGWNAPGVYPADVAYAMRWWNVLDADQMVAALYGSTATAEQAANAKMMYAALDPETKKKVNDAAHEIYGDGGHASVGAWWGRLWTAGRCASPPATATSSPFVYTRRCVCPEQLGSPANGYHSM